MNSIKPNPLPKPRGCVPNLLLGCDTAVEIRNAIKEPVITPESAFIVWHTVAGGENQEAAAKAILKAYFPDENFVDKVVEAMARCWSGQSNEECPWSMMFPEKKASS